MLKSFIYATMKVTGFAVVAFCGQYSLAFAVVSANTADVFASNVKHECVDASAAAGTQLTQQACHYSDKTGSYEAPFTWHIFAAQGVPYTQYIYNFKSGITGECLEVRGGSKVNGDIVQSAPCDGSTRQQWKMVYPFANQYPATISYLVEVVNVNSGLCMDVTGVSTADNAKIQQWKCLGQKNQLWDPFG